VTYSIANDDTREREISSLLKVAKHLQAKRLTIITYNEEQTISLNNGSTIEVIPLWKWLLER
jgi:predicted AAA+ superfamily ATPase